MAIPDDQPQTRFRVDLTAPQGRVVSTHRTDSEAEAVQAFAKIARTDFGKDLGRGANAALVDREQRLDASKVAEGHGVYGMRFLREEGRAAYEAIQPSPPGIRYPVDLPEPARGARPDRAPGEPSHFLRSEGSPDRTDNGGQHRPGTPVAMQNEMTAHRAQPDDDARTAALRNHVLDSLMPGGKGESQPRRAGSDVELANDRSARDVLGRANATELLAYAAARERSPEAEQQVLGDARKRIEADLEAPSGAQRRLLPPVEDRFNVVQGAGSRTYQFRDQPGKVAFTERWLSMATALDSAAVVKAMVDRAEERGWTGMRLDGSEEFKRQAWIAAEARGIKAVGYEPTQSDRTASNQERLRLAKEQPARAAQETSAGGTMTREGARAASGPLARYEELPESAGQPLRRTLDRGYAPVMGELERAMALKGVPEAKRASARIAVQRELDAFARQDKAAKVKLYDLGASRKAPRAAPGHQLQKAAEPDRAR